MSVGRVIAIGAGLGVGSYMLSRLVGDGIGADADPTKSVLVPRGLVDSGAIFTMPTPAFHYILTGAESLKLAYDFASAAGLPWRWRGLNSGDPSHRSSATDAGSFNMPVTRGHVPAGLPALPRFDRDAGITLLGRVLPRFNLPGELQVAAADQRTAGEAAATDTLTRGSSTFVGTQAGDFALADPALGGAETAFKAFGKLITAQGFAAAGELVSGGRRRSAGELFGRGGLLETERGRRQAAELGLLTREFSSALDIPDSFGVEGQQLQLSCWPAARWRKGELAAWFRHWQQWFYWGGRQRTGSRDLMSFFEKGKAIRKQWEGDGRKEGQGEKAYAVGTFFAGWMNYLKPTAKNVRVCYLANCFLYSALGWLPGPGKGLFRRTVVGPLVPTLNFKTGGRLTSGVGVFDGVAKAAQKLGGAALAMAVGGKLGGAKGGSRAFLTAAALEFGKALQSLSADVKVWDPSWQPIAVERRLIGRAAFDWDRAMAAKIRALNPVRQRLQQSFGAGAEALV